MFERFTNTARRVIVQSQAEARTLRHPQIDAGHILLGVTTVEDATAGAVLSALGVEAEALRHKVVTAYGSGDKEPGDYIPFSEGAKKALEQSLRESLAMDHTYIGTEHMLLGLIKDSAGDATQLLVELGVETQTVRQAAVDRLKAAGAEPTEP